MIVGIGTDIVEIKRINKIMNDKRDSFLKKIFTDKEIEFLEERNLRPEYIAGRCAAKEAIAKALGTGFREFSFRDITVLNDELGKPIVKLDGNAKKIADKNGKTILHLSISHGDDAAIAYAILEEV